MSLQENGIIHFYEQQFLPTMKTAAAFYTSNRDCLDDLSGSYPLKKKRVLSLLMRYTFHVVGCAEMLLKKTCAGSCLSCCVVDVVQYCNSITLHGTRVL